MAASPYDKEGMHDSIMIVSTESHAYDEKFFKNRHDAPDSAAQVIVPLVLNLIKPRSVIDVGCGLGNWLAVFQKHGVSDILGVDGNYVNPAMLVIPGDRFMSYDLKRPLRLERQFDLVVSLEVAEHLPPENADAFVDSLVRLGSVVLFSAAVPYQTGTHHVNEQWQDYWAEKFRQRGYVAVDAIRKQVWSDRRVAYYYAQNVLLYVHTDYLKTEASPALISAHENTGCGQISIIHPELLTDMTPARMRKLLELLPGIVWKAVARRLNMAQERLRRFAAHKQPPALSQAAVEVKHSTVDPHTRQN